MQATTYKFIFPDGTNIARDAGRILLAGILDGQPRAHELFHYREDGKPLTGDMPLVRIDSFRNYIQVISFSDELAKLFESFVPKVYGEFLTKFGSLPALSVTKTDVGVEPSERSFNYVAYSVIIDRGLPACEKFEKMSETERLAKVYAVLQRGIYRQADCLMLDVPDMPALEDLVILKYHPRAPIIIHGGVIKEHGISVNIGFKWEAKLSGSWAVGGLTSKGHGRIWYQKSLEGAENV